MSAQQIGTQHAYVRKIPKAGGGGIPKGLWGPVLGNHAGCSQSQRVRLTRHRASSGTLQRALHKSSPRLKAALFPSEKSHQKVKMFPRNLRSQSKHDVSMGLYIILSINKVKLLMSSI